MSLRNIIFEILNIDSNTINKFSLKSFIEINKLFLKYVGVYLAEFNINKLDLIKFRKVIFCHLTFCCNYMIN